jgi:hypothetical protein
VSHRYPCLGFDPAPGDVGEAARLDRALQGVVATVAQCRRTLGEVGGEGDVWRGAAADAFTAELRSLLPHLDRAEAGHREAQRALRRWADVLSGLQASARALEGRAADAAREVQLAVAALRRAQARAVDPADPAQVAAAAQSVAAARAAVDRAEAALEAARAAARRLADDHRGAAAATAAALDAASDRAPVEPGVLERIGSLVDGVVDGVRGLPGRVWDELQEHAHVLAEVSDALADLATVVGVVALFVPGPLGLVALGLAGLALAGHALADAAGAPVPASTYVFDVLGVATAGAGALGSAGVRGATAALQESTAAGRAGGVLAARQAQAYYASIENGGTVLGTAGTVGSTAHGLATASGDDRPFAHLVPDSPGEVALGLVSPGGAAFVSAVQVGRDKDRAAAEAAAHERWLR